MMNDSHTSKVQEDSDTIVQQFHPIVTQFGFTKPGWDYDPESDVLRVQFEDPEENRALQIDHHFASDSYNANYCTLQGDWQLCIEGKRQTLRKFKGTLSRWILDNCEECRAESKQSDESDFR
jgi:hypothetical protein